MKYAKLKALAIILGVFGLGAASGAALARYAQHQWGEPPGPGGLRDRGRHLRDLEQSLDLSSEQRTNVAAILERAAPERELRMRTAMMQCGKPLLNHKAQIDREIRALLSPDQQARFDKLALEQSKRLFGAGPPPPPPLP